MLEEPYLGSGTRRKSMDPVSQHIHLDELPTPGSRFELQELLGVGTCAKVYAATDKQKGNKVAVKIIDNIAENLLEIESEFRVLSSIGGQPLVPEFHGTYLHSPKNAKKQLWFVMELCEGVPISELLLWLRKEGKSLSEEEIGALLKIFMLAIYNLHQNDIIHRDIRASNFILSTEGDIKLIDYGSCALVKETEGKTHSSIGTPYWMAPEVINCEQLMPYTKSCDVWSLGITAIELAETQPPLFDIHPVRAMFQIARCLSSFDLLDCRDVFNALKMPNCFSDKEDFVVGNGYSYNNPPPTLKKLAEWSEEFKDFISECLERNAEHRPCILELLLHPFISAADDISNEALTMEEHLHAEFQPVIGSKVKQTLKKLGTLVEENLYPLVPSNPLTATVKNWNFKSDADSPYVKILPDDLAAIENQSEDSVVDFLYRRFSQNEIYTYIGDILVAINPRKKLPLYDSKIQMLYQEKARSDNPPHIFAVADRAYQQMLHHKRSQVIILFGKSNSGKSFSATQIINQLAFLSTSGNVAMAEKIQQLCPLLDAFGSTRTSYNQNASRLLKTISVTFTKTGKITGGILTATLLDRIRISSTPPNESNFHILYYLFEGLKSEKRLAEFGLDKLSSIRYLPQRDSKNPADLVAGYKNVYHAFRILSFTEEEILVVLRILSAILLLGDVTYTEKESTATASNPYLISSAAKNLSVDNEQLCSVISRGDSLEEVTQKRDAWVQFLYMRLFEWIVSSLKKQLSFSRLVLGDSYSVTVIDPPGFGAGEHNQMFQLSTNIIDDFLQNYIQQLIFFKELEEYKEESVDIPFKYEESTLQQQALNNLIESEKILLNGLQSSGVKGSFNWLKKMRSLPCACVEVENDKVTVYHMFQKRLITQGYEGYLTIRMGNLVKKFLRASMCNVFVFTLHMGILYGKDKLCKHDYALKAEDTQREEGILMQLLASAACHYANTQKTKIFHAAPQVSYNIQQLTVENISNINEMEFIETFKGTDDQITSAIANKLSDENSSLAEQTRFLLPKLLEGITEDFPHLVVCMQPTDSCREDIRFDPQYVVHQLRAFKLMETIMIRQKGYARRLSFSEFLNRYKYLAFDFDEEVELNKQNCQLLLIRLKMDGWKMGLNKVFLKYYAEEYLSRLYETHVKKIVKVQAMARRFIVKARHGRHV